MRAGLDEQILETLEGRRPPAAFVTEVAATIQPTPRASDLEETIAHLDEAGRVLIVPHAAPDVHLESTDLRVIAPLRAAEGENAARDAAEEYWSLWLRTFLANHHCE